MSSTTPVRIKKKKKDEDLQHDLMTLARDHFRKPENEYQVMARHWAFKLERMSVEQRRLAKKFINEILFEGEEGNLHRHSVVINPSQAAPILSTLPPISYTPSPIPQTPSPFSQTPSPIPQTPSPFSQTPSPIPQTPSPNLHTEQTYLTEPEVDTAAKFINNFYAF
ncbi:hypothetical protein QTP88_022702 [Uroleucon formosanum]